MTGSCLGHNRVNDGHFACMREKRSLILAHFVHGRQTTFIETISVVCVCLCVCVCVCALSVNTLGLATTTCLCKEKLEQRKVQCSNRENLKEILNWLRV